MSHLTLITTQFTDPALLKQAVEACGWTWHQGGQVRYYRGPADACDFTAELTNEPRLQHYNLGFQLDPATGTYRLLCDNSMRGPVLYDGSLGGETVRILNQLKRHYGQLSALAWARAHAFQVQSLQTKNPNTMHLRIHL